jgi:hypothetical protein
MLPFTRSHSPGSTSRRLALAALALTHLASCVQLDPSSTVVFGATDTPDTGLPAIAQPAGLPLPGYTLYCAPAPNASPAQRATLVDMQGRVVHEWNITGMPVVLLPGGSLLGSQFQRAGPGTLYQDAVDLVQESWYGVQEWTFSEWDDDGSGRMMARQHHDLQREGNPVGYYAPGQEARPRGKTLVLGHKDRMVPAVTDRLLQDDVVYEVSHDGAWTGYAWYAADHVDEMGFDLRAREAIYNDPRWSSVRGSGDWLHVNCASTLGRNRWYEELGDARFHPDNILIGSREANFIAIIDRQSGHIVWRVGPDMGPGQPGQTLGQFVGQHHAHMIPHGLPGAGNILVFDNGGASGYGGSSGFPKYTRLWSRVLEFNPQTLEKVWEYGSPDGPEAFFSYFISSAQRLPNGNTLIARGADGTIVEVTRDKRVVWKHVSGSKDSWGKNYVYRAFRVPPEWLPAGINPGNYPLWSRIFVP